MIMGHSNNDSIKSNQADLKELRELKRKKNRRNAFMLLVTLQASVVAIAYFLGRSHK